MSDTGGMRNLSGKVDLRAAARHPAPWINRALTQKGRPESDLSPLARRLGITVRASMAPGDLERLLVEILGEDDPHAVARLPHPTALPLSLAFERHPEREGALAPVYPEAFGWELKRRVRRRDHYTCQGCGRREGDLYVARPWDRYRRERRAPTVLVQGALQVAHPDSQPEVIDEARLTSLCSRCHNRLDQPHTWSSKCLTLSMTGQLTRDALDLHLGHLRDWAAEAERPLGALQPGGADLLLATILDRELPATARSARSIIPALERETDDDVRLVLAAARERLRLRGLMGPSGWALTRMLTCPQDDYPEQPQYLPRPGQEDVA